VSAVDASQISTISGSAADLVTVVNTGSITVASDYAASISGTASTTQLLTISGDTSGTLTVTNVTDTAGAISSFNGTSARAASILENATGTITAQGSSVSESVNFSSLLKGVTIDASGGNDSIVGTDFADVITGGTGADEMAGGNGVDTFVFNTGDAPTVLVGSLVYDKITDFNSTSDKLDFAVAPALGGASSGSTTLGGSAGTVSISATGLVTFSGGAVGDATLSESLAAVRSLVTDSGDIGFFEFNDGFNGPGTYVYQENGSTSADILVFLDDVTGVADTSSSSGDGDTLFIF
jgi:hypothetical protein